MSNSNSNEKTNKQEKKTNLNKFSSMQKKTYTVKC